MITHSPAIFRGFVSAAICLRNGNLCDFNKLQLEVERFSDCGNFHKTTRAGVVA